MRDGRMHQTTVRFGPDLWEALSAECERLGLSAAQYLREAALARLVYTAGKRGDEEYDEALVRAGAEPVNVPHRRRHSREAGARHEAVQSVLAASAVSAQSEQAWRRAREVREHAVEIRRQRRGGKSEDS